MMKAKGCFFLGNGQFEVREMTFSEPGPHEVLIRVKAAGVCGTDVHIKNGEKGSADVTPPVVLGHEFAGIVEKVGAEVTAVKPGDKVAVDPNIYCGRCRFCQNGQKQFCENLFAIGVNRDGGFAEYCMSPDSQVFKMADNISFESMAMCEPVACCLRGLSRTEVRPGDTALVVGGGAIGQIMAQLLRIRGAARVIVSEPMEKRRALALELGADGVMDPTQGDLAAQFKALAGKDGADVVVECVGRNQAVMQAMELCDRGARLVLFSVPAPDATVPLPLFDVYKKELRISGSFINPDTQYEAAQLISSGRLQLDALITHRFPVEETDKAIGMQQSPDAVKVIVTP